MRRLSVLLLLLWLAAPARAGSVLGDDFNEDEDHDYNGMPTLRLALETGYSRWMYNPDGITGSYDRYLNQIESGWNFASQASWFPWAKGGIGADWIWFLSKADQDGVRMDSTGAPHSLRDRASYVYYGPTFLSRMQFGRFGLIVGAFGGGLLDVHYAWLDNGKPNSVRARTFAVVPQVGWEYSFYRLVSMGVNARAVIANVKKYTLNGKKVTIQQPDDPHYWNNITMTRFELDAGLRFGL
jgi:hypothetical protein